MFKKLRRYIPLVAITALGLQACLNDKGEVPVPDTDPTFCDSLGVTYSENIVPLVNNSCAVVGCHDANAPTTTGNFTNYTELAERANNGEITIQVFDLGTMPQAPIDPLTDAQKDTLRCWIEAGAPNN